MRKPDIKGPFGKAWRVPLERAREWVHAHPERMHAASRDVMFDATWRDYWLVRSFVQGEDLGLRAYWRAVVLRDLRANPELPRFYREAEWDVSVIECVTKRGDPPVNGDGIFEWDDSDIEAVLPAYQFHGLSDRQATGLGDPRQPTSFAQLVVEALLLGAIRGDDWAHRFSRIVNDIRVNGYGEESRRPLEIAARTGFLVEMEDGGSVSLPVETTL